MEQFGYEKSIGENKHNSFADGMILLCGGCSKGRTVSAPSTNIENVENITFPEAGWVTAL